MPFDLTISIANRLASCQSEAAGEPIVLQLTHEPTALNPQHYADPFSGSNPDGSYTSLYAFRVLVDPIPFFKRYYLPSSASTEAVYGDIVTGATVLGDAGYARTVFASAQERFEAYRFIGLTPYQSSWRPVYATPADWYSVEQSGRFQTMELDLSAAETVQHRYIVLGASRSGEPLSWRIGDDQANAVSVPLSPGTRLQSLRLKYLEVHLTREWLNPTIFSMDGWFLQGQRAGFCSTGKTDENDGVLPLLTSSLFIGIDTTVAADWSEADRNFLDRALKENKYLALGSFVLQTGAQPVNYGASLDSAAIAAAPQTLYVIGWLSALVPLSPRSESHPAVLPVSIASFKATPAEGSRIGQPVILSWTTSSAVTLEIDQNVGVVCAEAAGCNTGEAIVNPTARTVYTLTATGRDGKQARSSVTVFPLPQGWLKTTVAAPWHTRDRPVLMAFAQQLWFMAGGTSASTNDIYASLDGASWKTVTTNAPWSLRSYAGGVVFAGAAPERMWLMGGADKSGTSLNDIWATTKPDGTAWERVSSGAQWAGRSRFGCTSYQGRIWVIGGWNGNSGYNDVWNSTDGQAWTRVTAAAPWSPRWNFGIAEFRNRLWIFGGQTGPEDHDVTNEIWSSADGRTWQREPLPPWGLRSFANAQVLGERLYLMGGARSGNLACDDLWRMAMTIESGKETITWTQLPTQSMGNSAAMASAKLAGGAWLGGGWRAPKDVPGPNQSVWLYVPGSS